MTTDPKTPYERPAIEARDPIPQGLIGDDNDTLPPIGFSGPPPP
jgi:hypothetical protein